MLYSLQILNTLVSVNNKLLNDIELQERHDWRERFLDLGGFTHLYMILITSDVSEMLVINSNNATSSLSYGKKNVNGHQQRHYKKTRSKLIKSNIQNQLELV